MSAGTDLFVVKNPDDPANDWAALVRDLEKLHPDLLQQWKNDYEAWKHQYSRFRQFEQDLLFTPTEAGDVPPMNDQLMRFHRRGIFALLSSGERCAELLLQLPLDDEQLQEKNQCSKRLRTLIDGLQESLDIWHRVNAETVELKAAS